MQYIQLLYYQKTIYDCNICDAILFLCLNNIFALTIYGRCATLCETVICLLSISWSKRMIIFKKNNALLSFLLVAQLMQGCIVDDMRDAIVQMWNKVTPSSIAHSFAQAVTQGEGWLRVNSKQVALLVASTALITFFMVNTHSKRNGLHHSGEFFTGFEEGQMAAKNDSDIYLTLQQEAYRQGWHDAVAYIERMQDQVVQQDATDPDLIELEKAFQELAQLLKGEPIDEISMHLKNNDIEIEVIVQK